jgi:hypothetical protein
MFRVPASYGSVGRTSREPAFSLHLDDGARDVSSTRRRRRSEESKLELAIAGT